MRPVTQTAALWLACTAVALVVAAAPVWLDGLPGEAQAGADMAQAAPQTIHQAAQQITQEGQP